MGKAFITLGSTTVLLAIGYATVVATNPQNSHWSITLLLILLIITGLGTITTGIIWLVQWYRNRGITTAYHKVDKAKPPIFQKQSWDEVMRQPRHKKLRESFISARASAKQLLLIKEDTDISNLKSGTRKLIDDAYNRFEFAARKLENEHAHHSEFSLPIITLMDLLKDGAGCLNRVRLSQKTLGESKSQIDENSREIINAINDILGNELQEKLQIEVNPIIDTIKDDYYLEVKNNGDTAKFRGQIEITKSETNDSFPHRPYTGHWELSAGDKSEIMHGHSDRIKIAHRNFQSYNRIPAIVNFTEHLDIYYFDSQSGKIHSWQSSIYSDLPVKDHHVIRPEYIMKVTISWDTSLGSGNLVKFYKLELSGLTEADKNGKTKNNQT